MEQGVVKPGLLRLGLFPEEGDVFEGKGVSVGCTEMCLEKATMGGRWLSLIVLVLVHMKGTKYQCDL